jgi:hypothetical protein
MAIGSLGFDERVPVPSGVDQAKLSAYDTEAEDVVYTLLLHIIIFSPASTTGLGVNVTITSSKESTHPGFAVAVKRRVT